MKNLTRRDFLKVSGITSGGLLISFAIPSARARALHANAAVSSEVVLNSFLRIDKNNSIRIILSRVEMGQGIWTTLPMLIADELDCDWTRIIVEHSPPGKQNDFLEPVIGSSTGGSLTTVSEFERYRLAGATARTMLINAAAKKLGVSEQQCKTENSFIIVGNKRVSYREVASDASMLPIPSVKLREPKDWKYIGKSQGRLDSPEKINGKAIYGLDVQFPDLLVAVVAHCPVFGGTVKSYDATAARAVHAVRDVIQIPTGVAVIAEHFWAAKVGRDALKIEWDLGANSKVDSDELLKTYRSLARTKGVTVQQKGDVDGALQHSERIINAEYSFPYLAHAPMEPLNCTVKISKDKCQVWVGTQSPLLHQAEVAAFLNLNPEQVELHTPYIGGSFGRRGSFSSDWVMEAVQIAKISGKFIKLIWTREDDIRGGYYRPVYLHNVQIALAKDGFPEAWQHRIVGQSLFKATPLAQYIVHNGIDYSSVTVGAPYSESIPHHSFELHTTEVGVPVLPWRSVGSTHTAYVVETLIDELAALSSIDPVEYRRLLLRNHPRHLAALNLVVEKSEWDKPLPKGRFKGVAVCEAMGSYVAQVVEVSFDNKKLRVHRVVCAIDCGVAVNPDGVRAQMEGGIIFALTAALYGEISLKKGQVQQANFDSYRMLRINETPLIEVHIVQSTEKMGGAGEPGVPALAPALANALFAATGRRIRNLPVRITDLI